MRRARVIGSGLLMGLLSTPVHGQTPAAAAPPANDYTQDANWLCRPGRHDACAIDLTTTVVAANGTTTREPWSAAKAPAIDCFYVYPTVSTDPGANSDMTPDAAEQNVVAQQFARFASVCRPFAPSYRQVTLAGLRQRMAGGPVDLGRGLAYDDVRDAWRDYLARDNRGRGVVVIGHSQGSFILIELLRKEIEGTPAQARLVSAILTGTTVAVPRGAVTGGTFKALAACTSASDVGCLITFSTYRSTLPPPADALFGHPVEPGQEAVCTNPATFTAASAPLHAYFSAGNRTIVAAQRPPTVWATGAAIDTPFVSVPGLVSARCASNANATYLEITVNGKPDDPRVDDIPGDIGRPGMPLANWGLHLVDMNLTMGDLVGVVGQQAKAWASRRVH